MVLTTYLGDVWVADGLDDTLDEVTWRRIATGLYEPMGAEVVDGDIYVIARDRIVRLRDLNGDMETDYYETFYADKDVSDFFHSFAFGLQADAEGNLYYAKSGSIRTMPRREIWSGSRQMEQAVRSLPDSAHRTDSPWRRTGAYSSPTTRETGRPLTK